MKIMYITSLLASEISCVMTDGLFHTCQSGEFRNSSAALGNVWYHSMKGNIALPFHCLDYSCPGKAKQSELGFKTARNKYTFLVLLPEL